jgi:glycine cleavage system H protein
MPVSGKVLEINGELESAPETVNSDPYGKGWMIRIAVTDLSELDQTLSASEYQAIISE